MSGGTFLTAVGGPEFLRLIKQPSSFELQLQRMAGGRLAVVAAVDRALGYGDQRRDAATFVDVVRALSIRAARLPEYTRRAIALSDRARGVRDALLAAREPAPLLFRELPSLCGLAPFVANEASDEDQVETFAQALQLALAELDRAYPSLLERLRQHLAGRLTRQQLPLRRQELAERAARVAQAAREPRMRGFGQALADTVLADDAWSERLGSYVLAKPPMRWTPDDETRAKDELDVLCAAFLRLELVSFDVGNTARSSSAIRIAVTMDDGNESAAIASSSPEEEAAVLTLVERVEQALDGFGDEALRLAALARVLRKQLSTTPSAV